MIGLLADAGASGFADARAGRAPLTARERGTTPHVHAFYLRGWRRWWADPRRPCPQLPLPLQPAHCSPERPQAGETTGATVRDAPPAECASG